jgi:hypothetical protein
LDVTVITDRYPSETSWTVRNQCTNAIQIQGGGYNQGETAFTTGEICVPKGSYIFTINDSYGDGICCSYGLGSFAISYNGSQINVSPEQFSFGTSTSITFGDQCPDNNEQLTPTANPTKSPTKSPTRQPTSSPTVSPTSRNLSCEDDPNFKIRLNNGKLRKCRWITQNPNRKSVRIAAYCKRDDVKSACPVSCGSCAIICTDDEAFTFQINNGKDKGCQWLTQNEEAVETRREKFCFSSDENNQSSTSLTPIGGACPWSCGLCSF